MTLKSLNTRYVKLIRKMLVMVVGMLLAVVSMLSPVCWRAEALAFNRQSGKADNSVMTTPLLNNEQKLTASDGAAFDQFGHSVAFSGSIVVVGAPDTVDGKLDQGSAYVFNRQAGRWIEAQKLTASDGAPGDQFGWSVAVSGSTIVVGAWPDDFGGNVEQGSAYVFNRVGGRWVETQKLSASDGAGHNRFGWSVAISGSTIIVGTLTDGTVEGAAYVFNRHGSSWIEEQKLTASEGGKFDSFGNSVALSGSTIVVGAIGTNSDTGAAYVFNRQGGSWVEEQKLTASDGHLFDEFGWAVAVSDSTVVVSAISTVPLDPKGSAYVFNRRGGSWVEEQKLTASDEEPFDEFGFSVAISGPTIVVGSPGDDIGSNPTQGSAYVFTRQGGDWLETQKLTTSEGGPGDFFGSSVALNDSTVVIGAQSDTIGTHFTQGSVYVFALTPLSIPGAAPGGTCSMYGCSGLMRMQAA